MLSASQLVLLQDSNFTLWIYWFNNMLNCVTLSELEHWHCNWIIRGKKRKKNWTNIVLVWDFDANNKRFGEHFSLFKIILLCFVFISLFVFISFGILESTWQLITMAYQEWFWKLAIFARCHKWFTRNLELDHWICDKMESNSKAWCWWLQGHGFIYQKVHKVVKSKYWMLNVQMFWGTDSGIWFASFMFSSRDLL